MIFLSRDREISVLFLLNRISPSALKLGLDSSIVNDFREKQPSKALGDMFVTDLPIVTELREEQPLKADHPMLVTELGIVIEVRELQFQYLLLVDYQYYTL